MKFYIYTLGCKVNTYESEMMKEKLLEAGFLWSEENPQIVVINTCSVTNMADNKSKKMVRHFKREFPTSVLVVCGCSVQNNSRAYEDLGIDILIGNKEKSKIVTLIKNFLETKEAYQNIYTTRNLPFEDMRVCKFTTHTRAFVKIQDGCDNFCSYCIIPYVRGSIRSKEFSLVVEEVKTLVENGHKEIVLTGIHTGSYGTNTPYDLTDLIHEISKLEHLKRIRISSIEITELNDKFLEELKENNKICNHLHIPLQAGSDEILKRMNRKYDLDYFEKKIKKIRSIRPDISITTDIIVGHPYETESLFQKTIETSKKIQFSKIHVFPYSVRTGTMAALMENQIPEEEKKKRSRILCDLSNELEEKYYKSFIGKTLEVLVEDKNMSCTSNYLKVLLAKEMIKNTEVMVKITDYQNGLLVGEEVSEIFN